METIYFRVVHTQHSNLAGKMGRGNRFTIIFDELLNNIAVTLNEEEETSQNSYWRQCTFCPAVCQIPAPEIKRCLLLGRKVMTNLDSIFKSETLLC